jgi:hypothetical protein
VIVLPGQERRFRHAKRGYACGWKPIKFGDRIQRYLTRLEWQSGEAGAEICMRAPKSERPEYLRIMRNHYTIFKEEPFGDCQSIRRWRDQKTI